MDYKFDIRKPMQVGGQAVLEGVMMRAPGIVATAVRKPDGKIILKKEKHPSPSDRFPVLKLPVLRGAIGLVDMLVVGIRSLNYSATIAIDEVSPGGNGKSSAPGDGDGSGVSIWLTVAASLLIGISVFFASPIYLTTVLFDVEREALAFNLVAGFMFSAIILFSVLDAIVMKLTGDIGLVTRLVTHIPLVPVVGGVSYEFIRFSAKHSSTLFGRVVIAPGLWLQQITTREPDEGQLEVALTALRAALGMGEDHRNASINVEVIPAESNA